MAREPVNQSAQLSAEPVKGRPKRALRRALLTRAPRVQASVPEEAAAAAPAPEAAAAAAEPAAAAAAVAGDPAVQASWDAAWTAILELMFAKVGAPC